ncbi:MAG: DUF1385 domain-containing protein [Solirubrobacterales bacterium]|nr:DUF1385 domain-containing protein [Solirubrobacterales bacterium]
MSEAEQTGGAVGDLSASPNGASANGGPPAEPEKLRLGGMALRNGLLIHGPTSWAAAARARDGSIDVAAGKKPNFGGNRFAKVPGMRGPLRLAEAFAVIPIARFSVPSARLPFEDPRVVAAGIASTVVGNAIRGRGRPVTPTREGIAAVVGFVPALVSLTGSDLAAYHGAEHKSIAGYEQDRDPAEVPKEHERCGSNLVGPMLFFSAAGQLVVDRLFESPGRVERAVSGIAGLSLSVEVFVLAERRPDSLIGRAVHAAGHFIQAKFATREPTPEQLEVAVAALDAVLAAERD